MGNKNTRDEDDLEMQDVVKPKRGLFQSVASDNEEMFGDRTNSSLRTKVTSCIMYCEQFLKTVRGYEAFYNLSRTVAEVRNILDELNKDVRYKSMFRAPPSAYRRSMSGFSPAALLDNDPIALMFDNLSTQMQSVQKRFKDITALIGDNNKNSSMDNANDEQAALWKAEYFLLKDEMEIMMAHQRNGLVNYKTFLLSIREEEQKEAAAAAAAAKKGSGEILTTKQQAVGGPILSSFFKTDKEARKFWANSFGPKVYAVSKKQFITALKNDVNFQPSLTTGGTGTGGTPKKKKKPVVTGEPVNWSNEIETLVDPTSDGVVTLSDFRCFLDWFGPFKLCLKNAEEVLKCPFFWGALSSLQAQDILQGQLLGSFIVRFNEDIPGSFYISCVQEQDEELEEYVHTQQQAAAGAASTGDLPAYSFQHEKSTTFHFRVLRKEGKYYLTNDDEVNNIYTSIINGTMVVGSASGLVSGGAASSAASASSSTNGHRTLQSLLDQYTLTFKRPFMDQTRKIDPMKRLKRMEAQDTSNSHHIDIDMEEEPALTSDTTTANRESVLMNPEVFEMAAKRNASKLTFCEFRGRLVRPSSFTTNLVKTSETRLKKAFRGILEAIEKKERAEAVELSSVVSPRRSPAVTASEPSPKPSPKKREEVITIEEPTDIKKVDSNTNLLAGFSSDSPEIVVAPPSSGTQVQLSAFVNARKSQKMKEIAKRIDDDEEEVEVLMPHLTPRNHAGRPPSPTFTPPSPQLNSRGSSGLKVPLLKIPTSS